jgi:hypothetical protein
MAQRVFTLGFHVPGSASANLSIKWTAPFDCTLLHVSAVGSNSHNATMEIGDSADANEYLTSSSIGTSGTPAEFDYDDFVDTSGNTHSRYYPRIVDGTIVAIAVDYDGASGTAVDDLTIVLTFAEG